MPSLVCVDPASVAALWPHVLPLFDAAFERFGTRAERNSIELDVLNGRSLLWIAWSEPRQIEAMLVTDLASKDGERVCRLRAFAAHRLARVLNLLEQVEVYARDEGCRAVCYVGRPGWQRALGSGYAVTHVHARKELKNVGR